MSGLQFRARRRQNYFIRDHRGGHLLSKRVIEGVLSGPDTDGLWYWRPLTGGGASLALPRDLVEPGWVNGNVVPLRVKMTVSGLEILGLDDTTGGEGEPLLLLNGEPLYLVPDMTPEPGDVVWAEVPYGRADSTDDDHVAKSRPVVIVEVQDDFVIGRAVYSRNSEGRGRRIREPERAGLKRNVILGHDVTLIPVDGIRGRIGSLAAPDRRDLGLS